MALVNMQQSAEEAAESNSADGDDGGDAPKYPYGLCLSLDEEALAKLGYTAPPGVGSKLTIQAMVTVTSASSYQTQGGEAEATSCWQITDMEVSTGGGTDQAKAATALYGGKS